MSLGSSIGDQGDGRRELEVTRKRITDPVRPFILILVFAILIVALHF